MIKRYNLISRLSKIGLILLSVICIVELFFQLFSSSHPEFVKKATGVAKTIINNAEVTVAKPVFTSNGSNSYKISAETVTKNTDGLYNLSVISGKYHMNNGKNATISAITGAINSSDSTLSLLDNVKIDFNGFTILTDQLKLDLKAKSAETIGVIKVIGDEGNITANEFKTTSEFNQIIFHGDVKTNFSVGNAD